MFKFLVKHFLNTMKSERGGGEESTVIQAPTTPAPSASESARDIYQARLQYDPQMAALEMQMQQQYMPQQAALYQALYNQYYPQVAQQQQQVQRQLYPQQSQILEAGAGNVLQNLQASYQQQLTQAMNQQALAQLQQPSNLMQRLQTEAMAGLTPTGLTSEQQASIDAIRQRQATGLSRQLRERSNLGGTLYGGRSQQLESQGLQELAQRYSAEDIDRIIAQRQQALAAAQGIGGLSIQERQQALQNAMALQQQQQQAAIPYMQIMYPQVGTQQPNIQPYQYQSAVPSADQLYNAMFQASQPNQFFQQGSPSPIWSILGSAAGAATGAATNRFFR